jgi:hypothetical protein
MAAEPELLPFDFGPSHTFDPRLVMEGVLWPLVDATWAQPWGKWRKDSKPGDTHEQIARGRYDKVNFTASITAFNEDMSSDDQKPKLLHAGQVCVETEVKNKTAREVQLGLAEYALSVLKDVDSDEYDDDYEADEWPELEASKLRIYRGASFCFDTDGDWWVTQYRSIYQPDGEELNIPLLADEIGITHSNMMVKDDLDKIQVACHIFSEKSLFNIINDIKNSPIIPV